MSAQTPEVKAGLMGGQSTLRELIDLIREHGEVMKKQTQVLELHTATLRASAETTDLQTLRIRRLEEQVADLGELVRG